jgi:threonyl-tRNA synthetase
VFFSFFFPSCVVQRIYGTAWESAEQLAAYQALKVEAARRDHRKLGQELDLFSIQDSAGGRGAWLAPAGLLCRIIAHVKRVFVCHL